MRIETFLDRLRVADIKVETDGDELTVDAPKGSLTPELVQQLKARKAELIHHLTQTPITIPMTEMQQDVWMALQLESASAASYNLATELYLVGPLQVHHLREAINRLIQRHEALRTLPDIDGETQHILPHLTIELPIVDLSSFSAFTRQQQLAEILQAEVTIPFDLYTGPLFRVKLVKLAAQEHILLLTAHHIIADGWSMGIITNNLAQLYTAVCTAKTAILPPVIPFRDYVQQQTHLVHQKSYQQSEAYWLSEFADTVPTLDLPSDQPRPAQRSFRAIQLDYQLDRQLVEQIKQAAAEQNSSFFAYMMTAYHALLYRLSGQEDIVVGVPVAGQIQYGDQELVGDCVNFLPIRLTFTSDTTFREILTTTTRHKLPHGFSHQGYPLSALLKKLPIKRDLSRLPLVSVVFNLFPSTALADFHEVTVSSEILPHATELYDIFLDIVDKPEKCELRYRANADLFEQTTIQRHIDAYVTLLKAAVAQPDTAVNRLPILSETAYERIVHAWNQTGMAYDTKATLPTLFENQVERTPQKTAVLWGKQPITYAELNQRANQLAHYLLANGVQSDQFIGLCLERTPDLLIGLLGIHKAGAAYLPLDPHYPTARLAYMLADTQAPVLITQTSLLNTLPPYNGKIILIDGNWAAAVNTCTHNPITSLTSRNLAYVIHTSGSTGNPKGVLIPQQNVVNFLLSMAREPGIASDDILLAVTTPSFDIAVLELFLPLITGGTVALAAYDETIDGQALAKAIETNRATILQATPATWQMLLAADWQPPANLKMLSGGEALPRQLADQLLAGGGELWNMYGPTETTVWSSVWKVPTIGPILIGRPIGNTQMYILDDNFHPVPEGVIGELWIAGDGVATGYLHRPDLTQARFCANPFVPDSQMYKTGDLARYLPDGTIVCLGRIDFQVKVRGHRLELGEVEAALREHTAVQETAVSLYEDSSGSKSLAAYIVLKETEPIVSTEALNQSLRRFLLNKLPGYMIPSYFVTIKQLPLTPNGKIDRRSLPSPHLDMLTTAMTPPATPLEEQIAAIWRDILGITIIGRNQDFFLLGGHSLLATRILTRLRQTFLVDLSLNDFFNTPTIAALAQQIDTARWLQGNDNYLRSQEDQEEFIL